MNILLLSLGLGRLTTWLETKNKILFIPNAGDPYDNPYFVEDDFQRLIKMGYKVDKLNLQEFDKKKSDELLAKYDVLFIAGGNSFYLLDLVRKSKFDDFIKIWISNDKKYIGSSAGSVILGNSLEPIKGLDDPLKAPNLKSMEGLNIFNFIVLPHYGKEKYISKYENIVKNYDFNFIKLKDNEAIEVIDKNSFSKVESKLILH